MRYYVSLDPAAPDATRTVDVRELPNGSLEVLLEGQKVDVHVVKLGNVLAIRGGALTPAQFDFPAVPPLGIRRNGNLLTIFWLTPGGLSYTLQANGSLQPAGWTPVPFQVQGQENQATIAPTNSATFFRLIR